ncbi:hypothetical protein [Chromobacterium rhizoryzae]|uniref:hypothetical protein n=1 Tax=Chromobacterium rhizoryzae TaxID=1778675 RepID=UPI0013C2E022|nr:hypothetical protein [Chromobacterium rhizoryzae]
MTLGADAAELKSYLQRDVLPPQPRINVLWPPPNRFDTDGVPVFDLGVTEVVVRSTHVHPECETTKSNGAVISDLGQGLYLINFKHAESEAVVWAPSGSMQRIRFDEFDLIKPEGVRLKSGDEVTDCISLQQGNLAQSAGQLEIVVPAERLWRNILVNGLVLQPPPKNHIFGVEGPLRTLEAGAFGSIVSAPLVVDVETDEFWFSRLEKLITNLVGPIASKQLGKIRTKGQLVQWAVEYKAQPLLPLMLTAISAEVDRGIP